MDYYGYDPTPEEAALKRMAAQVQALRGTKQPEGQMVSGYYVAPSKAQIWLPAINGLVADLKEGQMADKQKALNDKSAQALQQWIGAKPGETTTYGDSDAGPTMTKTEPTDAQTSAWAAAGLRNPLSRSIAAKSLEDTVVQAPIRAEKRADKEYLKKVDQQRFDSDRQARADLQNQRLDSQWNMLQSRLSNSNLEAGERNALNQQAMALRQQMNDANIASREKIAGMNNDVKVQAAQLKSSASANGKPLGSSQLKQLTENTNSVARIGDLESDFSDDMTGPKGYLNAETGGKFYRDDPKAQKTAEWWRNFRAFDNIERHALFGSALTAQEKGEWARTTVTPLSSPEQIKTAIATRKTLAERAFKNYADGLTANSAREAVANAANSTGSTVLKQALGRVSPSQQAGRDNDAASILVNEALKMPMTQDEYDGVIRDARRKGYTGEMPPRVVPGGAANSGGWSIKRVN